MKYRNLGRTGVSISEVSFGAWALGGDFGEVDDAESIPTLARAVELGVNFFDTADVYGDGRSERVLGRFRQESNADIFIATKAGRRSNPHVKESYTPENLAAFVERSLENLRSDALDLLQLHCPPSDVYFMPEVFDALDDLERQGKIKHYGVSVERVDEALQAMEYPGVKTVQIVYNLFRQRPADSLLSEAKKRNVGVLARLPLSSGLLAGKLGKDSKFEPSDHRNYNREGQAFDRGETFSGIDYELGLELVEQLRKWVPAGATMAQLALRWILMNDAVSAVIPGAKRPAQVEENVRASDLAPLSDEVMAAARDLYQARLKPVVHQKW